MDDDPEALQLAKLMLLKSGLDVVTAPTGDAALTLLAAEELFVDALITDYAMPGLSGHRLVEQALEQWTDLPALVITNYGCGAELNRFPAHVGVLTKPFAGVEFVLRVTQLTQSSAPMDVRVIRFSAGERR